MQGAKEYLAAFAAYQKITSRLWNSINSYFPSLEKAWEGRLSDFIAAGISSEAAQKLLGHMNKTNPSMELEKLNKHHVEILSIFDNKYPSLLKEIYSPPPFLFVKGKLKDEDKVALAVVGSRKTTDYGRRATTEITEGVAKAGVTIVSGLALGLDTEAHKAALKANGRTIAVLANGLDRIYPVSNTNLAKEIIENGAIISERPFGTPPLRQYFPARNRIISGLSKGILIAEAGERSGTLHTATFAIEQNRQLYTVPGPIYNPNSAGPNMLLKQGAKATTCASDILEDFGIEMKKQEKIHPSNENEAMIFSILSTEPKHVDAITRESGSGSHEISQILTLMEIKGKVKHLGGMVYTVRD